MDLFITFYCLFHYMHFHLSFKRKLWIYCRPQILEFVDLAYHPDVSVLRKISLEHLIKYFLDKPQYLSNIQQVLQLVRDYHQHEADVVDLGIILRLFQRNLFLVIRAELVNFLILFGSVLHLCIFIFVCIANVFYITLCLNNWIVCKIKVCS